MLNVAAPPKQVTGLGFGLLRADRGFFMILSHAYVRHIPQVWASDRRMVVMGQRSPAILAADVRADLVVGNDDLRQQLCLLHMEPETAKHVSPGALVSGAMLAVGLIFALVSSMVLLVPSASVFRQHETLFWASVVIVAIIAVVGGVIWIGSMLHRADVI
jgi:hypothetical protein